MREEDKLLLLCTIFENKEIDKFWKEIVYEKLDGNKLLCSLNGDNYKMRSLFIYNAKKNKIVNSLPDEIQYFIYEEENKAKEDFEKKKEEIDKIVERLNDKEYKYLLIKGIGVAETVYKEHSYVRDSNDIDILVSSNDADEIYSYFTNQLGYSCDKSAAEQILYREFFQHYAPISKNGIYVELHHRLTQRDDNYRLNEERMLQGAEKIRIKNNFATIPNSVDMLISLSYHLFQHEFREARFMLKPYSDIYNLLFYYGNQFDWKKFVQNVKEDNLEFPMFYSLYCTNEIYMELLKRNIVPQEVLNQLYSKEFIEKKEEIVSRHLLNGDMPIGKWTYSHTERVFMNIEKLRQELCNQFFFFYSEEKWKTECKRLNVEFYENFEFSPRAWKKYGRI